MALASQNEILINKIQENFAAFKTETNKDIAELKESVNANKDTIDSKFSLF
jgi:hypothetical protein